MTKRSRKRVMRPNDHKAWQPGDRPTVASVRTVKVQPLRPRFPPSEDKDSALTVKLVRFMDNYFGAGQWEQRAGEPVENKILRQLARDAFMAGAGQD